MRDRLDRRWRGDPECIGYVFVVNLVWRFIWAFRGNRYARWRAILPGGAGYWHALRSYVSAFLAGRPQPYLGHNPLGRIGVLLLLSLLSIQAVTGLVLAGTDLFYPPFAARDRGLGCCGQSE